MPEVYLSGGIEVLVSEEDLEIFAEGTWRAWEVKGHIRVTRDLLAKGKRYRLAAHREIAFRMRPKLLDMADRMTVKPRNGKFTDVRRENLEIIVRPRKPGATRRPTGHSFSAPYRHLFRSLAQKSNEPPVWSRDGQRHRNQTLQRDGHGRYAPNPGAGGRDHDGGGGREAADNRPEDQDGLLRQGPGVVDEAA